jgi:hypothetical protein
VPAGHASWWGVDPSSWRVALATVDAEAGRGVATVPFPRLEGGAQLAAIWRLTFLLAQETALLLQPGVVVVEQPSGKQANPTLSYATGVIMGALHAGVERATGRGVVLETVPSSRWKAVACGDGALWKPKRLRGRPAPAPEAYGVLRWAQAAGYRGRSWDESDAWGVAEYARRTFALEER